MNIVIILDEIRIFIHGKVTSHSRGMSIIRCDEKRRD